jgi:hypothetical protein
MSDQRSDERPERDPHHSLTNPVGEPDPTEWPDPYDHRDDPLHPPDPDEEPFGEEPHPATGSRSTSQPTPTTTSKPNGCRRQSATSWTTSACRPRRSRDRRG